MENKEEIIMRLKILLKVTRAGSDIKDMILNDNKDTVTLLFEHGAVRDVNIAADSGIAIIQDVVRALY